MSAELVASPSLTDLGIVFENVFGVTPASPSLISFPRNTTSLNSRLEGQVSDEVRADRMADDYADSMERVTGDITCNLRARAFDKQLEAVQGGSWAADVLNTVFSEVDFGSVTAVGSTKTFTFATHGPGDRGISSGDKVTFANLNVDENNKTFTVASVSAKTMVVTEAVTDMATADKLYTLTRESFALSEADLTSVTVVSSTKTFTFAGGDPVALGLRAGDKVRFAGLSAAGDNLTYTIASFSGATNRTMVVEETVPTDISTADTSFTVTRTSRGLTSYDLTSITASASAKTFTFASGDLIDSGIRVGMRVAISDMASATNNKTFTVANISGTTNRVMTVIEEVADATADTSFRLEVVGAICNVGTLLRSATIERAFKDIGRYLQFKGCMFNSAAIDIPAVGPISLRFGVIGQTVGALQLSSLDGGSNLAKSQTLFTSVAADSSESTFTVGASSWLSGGFAVGDVIVFSSLSESKNNDTPFRITALSGSKAYVSPSPTDMTADTAFTVTRYGLPAYTEVSSTRMMTAGGGLLLADNGDTRLGVVTGLNFTIDNGIQTVEGVTSSAGAFIKAATWGKRQTVSGQLTAIFDGGGLHSRFQSKLDSTLLYRVTDSDGNWYQFFFPRIRYSGGDIGDAGDRGIPITLPFTAMKPRYSKYPNTHVSIQRSYT